MPNLPSDLAIVLAAFATVVSHVLRDARLPKWLNMLIAALALALSALAALWLTNSFVSGDLRANIMLFFVMCIGIVSKEGYDLYKYLLDTKSPLVSGPPEEPLPVPKRRASADWTRESEDG